ncbi:DUF4906 domain-containing protein [Bacteroides sp.]|uniref:DUF4906 domain-containing protein n=1 Tax=Bacteroides sp. TaxID=29523 RepID=UPI0026072A4A|nr:DUF4906 domain-containing protein [Bacteroides sp.]
MLAMIVLYTSCQPDNLENEKIESRPAILHLKVRGEEQVDLTTRAVSEDAIHDLHILIYDSKGELIGQQYAESSTITIKTHSAGNCTIYAIANTGKPDLFNSYDIHSETALKDMTSSITAWDELTKGAHLLMTGSIDKVKIEAGIQTLSERITVNRMVAKITLNLKAKSGSGISITGYKIYSLPSKSYYLSSNTDATNSTWLESDTENTGNVTTTGIVFYMFENRRGIVSGITQQKDKNASRAPTNATYVIISGNLEGISLNWKVYLGENNTTDFNIKRNSNYVYNIILEAGKTDSRVSIETARITDLSILGTANCYLAKESDTWYRFKATIRGNGAATIAAISPTGVALDTNDPIIPKKAELVWETGGHRNVIQYIILSKDGYILFKTGNDKEGNAIIAVKDDSDNILWSWHIWKTNFDLNELNSNYTQTYKTSPKSLTDYNNIKERYMVMMDRNLGAYSNKASQTDEVVKTYGLCYQWGRKDPFPNSAVRAALSSTTAAAIAPIYDSKGTVIDIMDAVHLVTSKSIGDGTNIISGFLDYGIKHPITFICDVSNDYNNTNSSCSWIYGSYTSTNGWRASNKLWGNNIRNESDEKYINSYDTKKTIYDPCPAGWCLPPIDVWSNFAINHYTVQTLEEYNCKEKKSYTDVEPKWYLQGTVFGREYYINGTSGETAFYPASGFRLGSTGLVTNTGFWIVNWSTSLRNSNEQYSAVIWNNPTTLNTVAAGERMNGYPVRCVQEASLSDFYQ